MTLRTRRGRAIPSRVTPGRGPRVKHDRPVVAGMLLLPLILLALLALNARPPGSLDNATLSGARALPGPLCLIFAPDQSGSMQALAPVREHALRALVNFARRELEPSDRIAVVPYTSQAAVSLPLTRVDALPPVVGEGNAPNGGGTALLPALQVGTPAQGTAGCAAIAVATVTDTMLGDDPQDLVRWLDTSRLTRLAALVPDGQGRPEYFRQPGLAGVRTVNFPANDPDALGIRYGEQVAELLGMQLKTR